jgi:hypothetical protein
MSGENAKAEWIEEWPLYLLETDGCGLEILCPSNPFDFVSACHHDVSKAVLSKSGKFFHTRWGEITVLVMDAFFSWNSERRVIRALYDVPKDQLSNFDLIALYRSGNIELVYEKPD